MREDRARRCKEVGLYIVMTHCTIRQAASVFGYSKSTVHSDVSYVLKHVDLKLYNLAKKVLENNFSNKHIRGGIATKKKYQKIIKNN